MSKHIVAYDVSNPWSEMISSGIVDFMLDHYHRILQVPHAIDFTIDCAIRATTSIHRASVLKKLHHKDPLDQVVVSLQIAYLFENLPLTTSRMAALVGS